MKTNFNACTGFYKELQNHIIEKCNPDIDNGYFIGWGYVANQTGGFFGMWYHPVNTKDFYCYIQLEDIENDGIRVTLKTSTDNAYAMYGWLETIKKAAEPFGLKAEKPSKFKAGTTSTLAIFPEIIDYTSVENTIKNLDKLTDMLNTLKK